MTLLITCLVKTVFSLGIGLYSADLRAQWATVFSGKKVVTILSDSQSSKQSAITDETAKTILHSEIKKTAPVSTKEPQSLC